MSAVQVLGVCGLTSSVLSFFGGFANEPVLIGIAGGVMFLGNLYALAYGKKQ
jgi:hypothetical protein